MARLLRICVAAALVAACSGVSGAPSAGSKGALTSFGQKWGWAGTGEAFVPQLAMYATPDRFYGRPDKIDADIRLFLEQQGFNGFHVGVNCRWFDLHQPSCAEIEGTDPAFDQRTFDALEMLIRKTHAAGGMVHIWMWGDEQRAFTASARDDWGGQMGPVERGLLDEIARQLGPIEGWSMGYGFDLDEWVTVERLRAWHDYLHGQLQQFHFLGGRPEGPNHGTDHAENAAWNDDLDYASYEHHRPSYEVYVAALEASGDKPVMSEDRFRIRSTGSYREKGYTPDSTRRGLWRSAMAGGVANIWGNLEDGGSHDKGSAPYPNPDELKTYARFFEQRFKKDLERCNVLTGPGVRCLGRPTDAHYLFYAEDQDAVRMDLSQMDGPQRVIAVDAEGSYEEVDLGTLEPGVHTWQAPHRSDWAVAVGTF